MTKTPTSIRAARPGDAESLPAVERSASQSFLEIPHLSWIASADDLSVSFHEKQIAQGQTWVATDHLDAPVGFITVEPYENRLHIVELSVAQGFQGRGLGRLLIGEVVDHARGKALSGVTLTTFRAVAWNAPFYRRLGFGELADEQLNDFLRHCIDNENKVGLQRDERCAMLLVL